MATIVLGAQWGDEGKGKLVDILCPTVKLCARAQGGNNAGHTIVANGVTYDFHLLPSGLINPECTNLIGSGVVVHVPSFFKELKDLEAKGLQNAKDRIFLSDRAQVVFDLHQLVDGLEEVELGGKSIGTTRKGIGPSYSTKATRSGVRIAEIFNEVTFEEKLRELARGFKKRYGDLLQYDVEEEISRFKEYRRDLAPFVVDAIPLIQSAQQASLPILIEGANALMLDLDYGTYPYVTSSNTGLGGIFTGLAINPAKISSIIGVVKAYTTRVGGGPFPTEDLGEDGTKLQEIGREFGVTTGRKRRCGYLDLVVVKYSAAINHYTSLNVTKLDVLDTFPTLKVATAYIHPDTGEKLESFPADLELLSRIKVEYKELKGWEKSTTGAATFWDLPKEAREYVDFIENFVGIKVQYIGTGPGRESMIKRFD
ncbi:Adenylosuccinate synthetase [Venustampulla echinocandica]|uniref:Adenylosuccinate synthetase n=1 Tax=Venustampulla echinocandica TaxID=2656787 RepID=A0A370TQI5_9HELO|nr:Adenylosuccinate synthetase [Venustampulla echinocandica]RDL37795.1 Adenylosuccinate synthetase [Venustampulla echinocandica]